jgi:hypothetical protein
MIGVYAPLGINPVCQFWILQPGHGWFLPSAAVSEPNRLFPGLVLGRPKKPTTNPLEVQSGPWVGFRSQAASPAGATAQNPGTQPQTTDKLELQSLSL